MDFGMVASLERFLVRAFHSKDTNEVNTALSTSFLLSCCVSIASLIVTAVIIFLTPLFMESNSHTSLFQYSIGILGLKIALQLPLFPFYGILIARYRYDIISNIQFFALIIKTILTVYFVSNGHGIITIAIITLILEMTSGITIVLYAKKLEPDIRVSLALFKVKKLKEYFQYGKYVYVIEIAEKIRFSIDDLVVGAVVGVGAVTHYTIATALVHYFSSFIVAIFDVISPVFNKYHKLEQWGNLREIFLVITEITTLTSFLIGGLLLSLGQPFISIWIGNEYNDVYPVLLILCIANIFSMTQLPSTNALLAIGKHQYYAKILSTEAMVNLALSLLLAQYLGIIGIALGTLIPSMFNTLILLPIYTSKQLDMPSRKIYKILIKGCAISCGIFLPAHYITQYLDVNSYFMLIILSILFSGIFIICYSRLALSKNSISYILDSVPEKISPSIKILIGGTR